MDTRRRDQRRDGGPSPDAPGGLEAEFVELGSVQRPASVRRARLVAVATVASLGTAVLVATLQPGPAVTPVPTPGSSARAAATPVPSRFPSAWDAFELRGYGRGATVEAIWVVGDRFAAEVETDDGPDGGPYGPVSSALLTSVDGRSWEQFDLPAPGFVVEAGVVADRRLLVVGHDGSAEPEWQAWSTADGEWRREADPVGLATGNARIEALAVGGCEGDASCEGFVAGVAGDPGTPFEELRVSEDGTHWRAPEVPDIGPFSIRGVAWQGGRWNVLAVLRSTPPGSTTTGVLTSTDMETWAWTEIAELAGGGRGIAASAETVVVTGAEEMRGLRSPRSWVWNGAMWQLAAPEIRPGREPAGMDLVLSTELGFLGLSSTTGDAWLGASEWGWVTRPAFEATPGDAVRTMAATETVVVAGGRSAAGRPMFWTGELGTFFAE